MAALSFTLIAIVTLLVAAPVTVRGRAAEVPQKGAAVSSAVAKGPERPSGAASVRAPTRPRLLVMDVDAGADDAMGLLLALGEEQQQREEGVAEDERLRLLAITCTHGNTPLHNVERNVLKTLHVAERLDVPVYSGASQSLILTPPGDNYFGNDGFGDFKYKYQPDVEEVLQKEHAVNALTRLAREHPGEITLLALGPLSNLALATRMDPNFLSNLHQLFIMGGDSEGLGNIKPATEFNFFIDPEADFIVFNSSRNVEKPVFILPWDSIASRNHVSMEWRLDVLGKVPNKVIQFLNSAERFALESDDSLWMSADPATTAILLHPELITASQQHHVDVEMHGDYGRGALFVDYNDKLQPKNTVIVKEFDVAGYKNLLLQNLDKF